ncbi:hypothetical protein HK098_007416 [Nowakowskiella sp. JEL0407]|nr:hypothetical protein HK098_007416 [Nowakowskiella sp. JEL0407]
MKIGVLVSMFAALAELASAAGPLGSWKVIGETGVVCIHSAMLPGPEPAGTRWKILCAERPHHGNNPYPNNVKTGGESTTEVDVFNTAKPFTATHVARNPFCGGQVQMADGRIFSAGGDRSTVSIPGNADFIVDGRTARRIYTPLDQIGTSGVAPWTSLPDMTVQRWYPTIITLETGRQLIVSGSLDNLDLANMTLTTKNPTYEYYPPQPNEQKHTLQILDRAHPWNLYPQVYLLPKTGKVFIFAGNESAIIDTKTDIADETSIPPINDPRTFVKIYPFTPTGVLLPLTIKNNFTATIRLCGGTLVNNQSAPYCHEISPEAPGAAWVEVDPLPTPKVMPDVVILPDGKLLYMNGAPWGTAGGDGGQAYNAHPPSYYTFLYDHDAPRGNQYINMTSSTVGRLYHSGALLTPDGRVVTVGNEMANWPDIEANRTDCFPFNFTTPCIDPFETRVEAFEPPYFNVKNRISVDLTRVPRNLTHGTIFEVFLNSNVSTRYVSKANFIRYGSTTHSTNSDQRLIEAVIQSQHATSGRLVIEIPPNPVIAPPGNYMLWLLDESGVPSENSVTILFSLGAPDVTSVQKDSTNLIKPVGGGNNSGSGVGSGAHRLTTSVAGALVAILWLCFDALL